MFGTSLNFQARQAKKTEGKETEKKKKWCSLASPRPWCDADASSVMARPLLKIGHGLDRFRRRRSTSSSSSSPLALSLSSSAAAALSDDDPGSPMDPEMPPAARRRCRGARGRGRLSFELPPLAGGPSDKEEAPPRTSSSSSAPAPARPAPAALHEGPPSGD